MRRATWRNGGALKIFFLVVLIIIIIIIIITIPVVICLLMHRLRWVHKESDEADTAAAVRANEEDGGGHETT